MDYQNFRPTVNLSLETIIRECSLKPVNDNHFANFCLSNRENIHQVFRYKKFIDDFTDYLTCYNDGNYFIGSIHPCYEEFLYKLCKLLNAPIKGKIIDDEKLTKELNDRLELLERITTRGELEAEFPLIYQDLIAGRRFIDEIESLMARYPEDQDRYKKQLHYHYSCALKRGLSNFINTQAEMYRRFIQDRKKYKEQIEEANYNNYIRTNFDINKLAMYITHEYLCICESTKDQKVIRYYLSLIDKYLNDSGYKKDVTLTTCEGIVLNQEIIKQRINNLRRQISDNSSAVNWIIVPKGKGYSKMKAQNASKIRETTMDYQNFRPTVNLSLETIIRECSLKPVNDNHFANFCLSNRENIHQVFRYKKFSDDFTDYLTCYNDGNYFVGTIHPCYEEFLYKLCKLLNAPFKSKIIDDEKLTKELNARLELLKRITTLEELEAEFPLIYKDLIDGRNFIDEIESLMARYPEDPDRYKKQVDYYYSCALKRGLSNFINTQAEMYRRFIQDRKKYKEQIEEANYNNYICTNFDTNKLAMYITHEYLCICESTKDQKVIRYYLSLIDKYLNDSGYKKDVTLTTCEGIVLNQEMINQRINNLRRQISDNSSAVNWIIVPKGKGYSKMKAQNASKIRETIFNYEELERLRQRGQTKRTFYEGTDYLVKAIGVSRYQGYCAYIYENGKVVLDREYEENHPKSAIGDAIYVIEARDFEALSRLDKATLRKYDNVRKINHSSTWQERVRKIISEEATPEKQEEAKQLIKKLK